jgi:Domain of unknown function (DUF4252)
MKKICVLICLLLAFSSGSIAQSGMRKLYRKHKHTGKDKIHLVLPRPVFWVASLFPKSRYERKLVRKIKQLKIFAIDQGSTLTSQESRQLIQKAELKGFEPLLSIRKGSTLVSIQIKERRNKIRKLFIVVHEKESFVFISMKTRVKIKDLEPLLQQIGKEKKMEDIPVQLPIQLLKKV